VRRPTCSLPRRCWPAPCDSWSPNGGSSGPLFAVGSIPSVPDAVAARRSQELSTVIAQLIHQTSRHRQAADRRLHLRRRQVAVAYLDENDGTWKVGWKGSYSVADDQVTMYDELNVTDVYRWKISEAGLDLDRIGSDKETVDGFPNEVFDAAYLSDSWTPTDCPMETDKPC
jgi:hypothetical protein